MNLPKKKKWAIVGGVAAGLLLAALMVWFVIYPRIAHQTTARLTLYCYNPTTSRLEPDMRTVPTGNEDALRDAAVRLLCETFRSNPLSSTMPDPGEFIAGYTLNGNVLEAAFTARYYELTPLEEAIFRTAFVWTMTAFPSVEQVSFTVEGVELLNSKGNPLGLENKTNVINDPAISPERITTRTFVLYFVNEAADGLIPEEYTSDNVNMDQVERDIVQLLIDRQTEPSRIAAIPAETKIREIKTEDGICYVDLSSEFNSKFNSSPALARLMLYSIVNSLIENVSKVKRVQFLIDSEILDQYQGVPDFKRLFEKDETLLAE